MEENQNPQEQVMEFESPNKKSNKKIVILVLAVLIILAVGLIYFFVFIKGPNKENLIGGENKSGRQRRVWGRVFLKATKMEMEYLMKKNRNWWGLTVWDKRMPCPGATGKTGFIPEPSLTTTADCCGKSIRPWS